jgi:hypothetical protein
MNEHPILFSGPMIQAILAGHKTQTRRVLNPQPIWIGDHATGHWHLEGFEGEHLVYGGPFNPIEYAKYPYGSWFAHSNSPYGVVGDRLWVRETGWERPDLTPKMTREGADTWPRYMYDADNCDHDQLREWGWKRRPSIFMPRWASRITLEITGLRVERVQDISEEDAIREGVETKEPNHVVGARYRFGQLWNSINAKRNFGWDVNPWVWVVEFKRIQP